MSNKPDSNNIITIYEKKLSDKPLSIDKIQAQFQNHGDDIRDNLEQIAKMVEEIHRDIEEDTKEDIVKIDFKKKKDYQAEE